MNDTALHRLAALNDGARFLTDTCPFCGCSEHSVVCSGPDHLFDQGRDFHVLACRRCHGRYTQGSDFATVSEYYETSYPPDYYRVASGGRQGDAGSNPRMREVVLAHLPRPTEDCSLLDVGSGNGGFLNHVRDSGLTVKGVEISPLASSYCREHYGIDVFNGALEDLPDGNAFDAITFVGVMEHLLNPLRTLRAAAKHLRTDGILVFDFPNVSSLEARVAGTRWWALDLPRHAIHFTTDSAAALAAAAGFEVVQSIEIPKTWFHPGFLSPPVRDGVPRHSLRGLGVLGIAAAFRLARLKPHVIFACCRKP